MTAIEPIGETEKTYLAFHCESCGVEFVMKPVEGIEIDFVGVIRFKCQNCNLITKWVSFSILNISEDRVQYFVRTEEI
jgi:hypothetical protein